MSRTRFTDDWIPLPESLVSCLFWKEGDELEVELVDEETLLIHRPPSSPGARSAEGRQSPRASKPGTRKTP
jgi:hypothetical protein